MIKAIQSCRNGATKARKAISGLFTVLAILSTLCGLGRPVQAHPTWFGINLPWLAYGHSFGTDGLHGWGPVYNASTVQGYLDDMKSKRLNMVRVFLFEDFQGLSFSGSNCTGVSSTFRSNLLDFVKRANGDGITVYCTFLNFMDVTNYSYVVTTNKTALINNAIVPVVKDLQPYKVQYDLINEANTAAWYWNGSGYTNRVGWSNIRSFVTSCLSAMKSAGNTHWVTMSGQDPNDFKYYFSSTFGGLGLNFYDCHSYSSSTSPLAISPSTVGNAPLFVGEYGPPTGWANYSSSANQTVVDNYCNAANSLGYYGQLAWCYLNDGSGYQLQGSTTIWTIQYYGNLWGIN